MAWPNVYTYNFCSNPSFEVDLTGVAAFNGGVPTLDTGTGLYGLQSLSVTTPGLQSNEGVILPPGTVLASGTGVASFYLTGSTPTSSGTLTAYAIDTTSSTTLGSTPVEFDSTLSWQRVVITDLNLVNGHNIAVYLETVGVQQVQFNVDGVQYEPALAGNGSVVPTAYVDGDQPFGAWVGTPEESASFLTYQFQLSATGNIQTSGAGSLLAQGAAFQLVFTDPASGPAVALGGIDLSGKPFQGLTGILSGGGTVTIADLTVGMMFAGLNDFATFLTTDVDPAIALVGYNNTGVSTGTNTGGSAGYTRPFATFSAPQAFTGSTSANIWNTAAYFSVGYQLASMATTITQNVTHVQAETVPNTGAPILPSSWIRPRAITAIVAPTRLNYITNPSFETATTGWSATTNNTLTRVSGGLLTGSSWSGQMVTTAVTQTSYIAVPSLIVGETYMLSMYVESIGAAGSVTLTAGAVTSSANALVSNTVTRISFAFTATMSNTTIGVTLAAAGTLKFDGVLLEPGDVVEAYADGSFSGWNWEDPTNPSITRSYYYPRGNIAYAAVQEVLADHLPLGLTAYSPVYNTPPTQYS